LRRITFMRNFVAYFNTKDMNAINNAPATVEQTNQNVIVGKKWKSVGRPTIKAVVLPNGESVRFFYRVRYSWNTRIANITDYKAKDYYALILN